MTECKGTFYSEDSVYKEVSQFPPSLFNEGTVLYEVLRVTDKMVLFLEDHIQRLQESVWLSGYQYSISVPVIHYLIRNLIRRNVVIEGNIKVVLHFKAQGVPVLYTYFIPHAYPTPAMYKNGVEADLFMAVRTDPNIKRMLPEMRQRISEFVRAENLYDALLVDEEDNLTEGSKTNVFFVQGENILTAPGHKVLKGITRQKIIPLCNQLNYKVIEKPISIIHLQSYQGAFFTGTSPKVLPIRRIANIEYKLPHPVIKAIMEAYDSLLTASVSGEKSSLK